MTKKNLKNQKVKGLFLISIIVLVWCCPSDYLQRPALGEKVKEPIILSPQESGSAWDLPAGVYHVDEQEESDTSGGTPTEEDPGPLGPGGSRPVYAPTEPCSPESGGSPNEQNPGPLGPGGSPVY